jgi:hypothetical protein
VRSSLLYVPLPCSLCSAVDDDSTELESREEISKQVERDACHGFQATRCQPAVPSCLISTDVSRLFDSKRLSIFSNQRRCDLSPTLSILRAQQIQFRLDTVKFKTHSSSPKTKNSHPPSHLSESPTGRSTLASLWNSLTPPSAPPLSSSPSFLPEWRPVHGIACAWSAFL